MKYKVGDHVLIKSLDWYNSFKKDECGNIDPQDGILLFSANHAKYCGQVIIITEIDSTCSFYRIKEEGVNFTDAMIECRLVPENNQQLPSKSQYSLFIQQSHESVGVINEHLYTINKEDTWGNVEDIINSIKFDKLIKIVKNEIK